MNPELKDTLSKKLWDGYFRRVKRLMTPLPAILRDEMILELEGHLLESFSEAPGDREPDRLQYALDELGDPEVFIKPLIADRLLEDASHRLSPRSVILAIMYNLSKGIYRWTVTIILSIGYILAVTLGLTGIAKIFIPGHAGLFITPNQMPTLGIVYNPSPHTNNVLGWWFTPIAITMAILLYVGLTKCWRLLLRQGR